MRSIVKLVLMSSVVLINSCTGTGEQNPGILNQAVMCDKVTTFVCPGDPCLCAVTNCALPNHNGDYVPCVGPPVPGCVFDPMVPPQCFPFGFACSPSTVHVNMCGEPCNSDFNVMCTPQPGGCCKCVRMCH